MYIKDIKPGKWRVQIYRPPYEDRDGIIHSGHWIDEEAYRTKWQAIRAARKRLQWAPEDETRVVEAF